MANFNKVLLIGNLTRDPELRYTQSGLALVKFGLAVNRRRRNRDTKETTEETCFVDITGWGAQAETFNQYMKKGRPVFIEGRLQYSTWESKEGQKRSKLEVVMENFQFLGGGGGGAGGAGGSEADRSGAGAPPAQAGKVSESPRSEDYDFEDIPF